MRKTRDAKPAEVNPLPFYSVRRQQTRSPPLPQPPHGANKRQLQNKGSAGAAGPAGSPPARLDPSAAGALPPPSPPSPVPTRRAERSPGGGGGRQPPASPFRSRRRAAPGPSGRAPPPHMAPGGREGRGGGGGGGRGGGVWRRGRGLLPPQPAEGGAALTPRPPRSCWR